MEVPVKKVAHEPLTLKYLKNTYGNVKYPGKLAVVVGGTSGIGRGIAVRLAQADINVVIVGRNEENGKEVVEEMKSKSSPDAKFSFVKCDAQELAYVKQFSDNFLQEHSHLDYLVLTQGIATIQGRTETKEGLDQKMSLHFYSRMAFIKQLLPVLQKSESPRVLCVLSAGVHSPYDKFKEDPELKKEYSLANAANAAGFYLDLTLDAFSRNIPSVAFIHSAPGFVNTNWGTEMPAIFRGIIRVIQTAGKSPEECAQFMCEPLLSPDLPPGFYLRGESGQEVKPTSKHNDDAVDFLWKHTNEVLDRLM